jgi:DNA invertase Pin-like site-specific DNA recombinase
VRVSSKVQTHKTQQASIEAAARARGDEIAAWYAEKKSGGTMKREELDRLRADVRTGIVRKLYVFKLDRLTRTGVSDTYAILAEFQRAGCEVVAVSDNLHIKPGDDDLASTVFIFALSLAAKLERTAINERIAAARERLASEGKPWGRRPRLQGERLEQARRLRAEGRSIRAIAVALKVPHSSVARSLSRKDTPENEGPVP